MSNLLIKPPNTLTVGEAAELLQVSKNTVNRLLNNGVIAYVTKLPGRRAQRFIPQDELDKFLAGITKLNESRRAKLRHPL